MIKRDVVVLEYFLFFNRKSLLLLLCDSKPLIIFPFSRSLVSIEFSVWYKCVVDFTVIASVPPYRDK